MQALRKAAFLDRDGVINLDRAYVSRWEDFEFVPGAIDAMRSLKQSGFALVVVTNQSGIARGYYTEDQFQALTITMKHALAEAGAAVDAVYHCPHHPVGCRGRFERRLRLSFSRSKGVELVSVRLNPGR